MNEKSIVQSVNREIAEMRTERFIDGKNLAYPSNMKSVKPSKLPSVVRTLFIEFVANDISIQRAVRADDGESFDPREEMEIGFSMGDVNGNIVWCLGIHDPQSPFNPSGHDFYAFNDGTFYGWTES